MSLPFALLRSGRVVLLGYEDGEYIGFDPVSTETYALDLGMVDGVASTDPAAVYWGVDLEEAVGLRMAANRRTGAAFPVLPEGMVSGWPVASQRIRKHRALVPSEETIALSMLFAISTIQTTIEQAEKSVDCFTKLYRAGGRTLPSENDLKRCFVGLQNTKSRRFRTTAAYAATVRSAMMNGWRDRELRRALALHTDLPDGLGLAKLSFSLALLGQDCICLDGRILNVMFGDEERALYERAIGKRRGVLSEEALLTYERTENDFLRRNPNYDPIDPLGRARCQWMSWEAVGGKPAEHRVWLNLIEGA